jgi:GNAT superfamily N-acetyltransferase
MRIRIRQASSTDGPTLMHIEHSCRTAASFLPPALSDPGLIRPRQWRAWLNSAPPYDRHPTPRLGFVAYEHSDILGFICCMHDSLFAGYRADIAGLYVLPRFRRFGIGSALLIRTAQWLQEDGIDRVTADCYSHDPTRQFFDRMGGVVIASTSDDADLAAKITYGFANLKALAAKSVV